MRGRLAASTSSTSAALLSGAVCPAAVSMADLSGRNSLYDVLVRALRRLTCLT